MNEAELPAWPEIREHALSHLHKARVEMSEAADWLRGIDSPLTAAERGAAREALRITGEVKRLIDQAKDVLGG